MRILLFVITIICYASDSIKPCLFCVQYNKFIWKYYAHPKEERLIKVALRNAYIKRKQKQLLIESFSRENNHKNPTQ